VSDKRISALLDSTPELQAVNSRVRLLLAVQTALSEVLPSPLVDSTSAASINAGKLVLFADNGAVAAKLRLMAPRILAFLRLRDYEVTAIHVQVQVRKRDNSLPEKQISLSQDAARALSELAATLATSPLKGAIERLLGKAASPSNHHKKPLKRQ
jgi:hypothetical protein